jgi:serine/threonine protein kinase
MTLAPGHRFGTYEITALLDKGGMGEVYQARDTTLGRDVAIKVLSDSFAIDPSRVARFEREAKLLASLNHPNVAHLYGVAHTDGRRVLVMELVLGETMAERIAKGPVPVPEALRVALQVAAGLEAAHDQHIVHRDLKPANIKVRPDGTVKVLDFGLAKALDPVDPATDDESAGGAVAHLTRKGALIGTPTYMSPEQARGDAVDARTDVWAFGTVLYEMLVGRPAFAGKTATDTLLGVLTREPDYELLPRTTSAHVRRLLRRCLAKEPARRCQTMGDVTLELEDVESTDRAEAHASRVPAWMWAALAVGGVAVLTLAALLVRADSSARQRPSKRTCASWPATCWKVAKPARAATTWPRAT